MPQQVKRDDCYFFHRRQIDMVRYRGINHLAMVTSDMEATIRFWRDLLGLRLIGGTGRKSYRLYFFELSPADMIAFFEWPSVRPADQKDHGVPRKGPFIFDHVSLGVESKEDLWKLKGALEAAGFWVSEAMDHGFIISIYSFDPNGIPIEFSWQVPGTDLRNTPLMLDRNPSHEAQEGSEPVPGKWPPSEPTAVSERIIFPGEGLDFREDKRKDP
jgi:catechol 2,3-dioxygenase-like lactoylglutathione lyase family enzyme